MGHNELTGRLNKEARTSRLPRERRQLGALLDLVKEGTISGKIAKDLFEIVWSEAVTRAPSSTSAA